MATEIERGEKTLAPSDNNEWYEINLNMDSKFAQVAKGTPIAYFTLEEILEQFAPEGTKFFPMKKVD